MSDPKSLISAYPVQELTDLIKKFRPKKIHVYVDLKNVLHSLFVSSVANELWVTSQTLESGLDTSITQATIHISSVWKNYARTLGLDSEIFVCTDKGKSYYHRGINKDYKARRDLTDMYGGKEAFLRVNPNELNPKDRALYMTEWAKEIRDRNTSISEKILNAIPGVHYYCLKNLEADFLPHYLISRKFQEEEGVLHVVCSGDKDLYQTLNLKNTVMLYKRKQRKYIISKSSIVQLYSKFNTLSQAVQVKKSKMISVVKPDDITAAMSIVGDVSDDVPGVKGIGEITAIELMSNLDIYHKIVGPIDELEDRIASGGKFFKEDVIGISSMPKKWQKAFIENDIVTDAFKMISFEMLCRWLENKSTIKKMEKLDYIDKITSKDGIAQAPNSEEFHKGVSILEDYKLSDETIVNLF
ncbi:MAG: hypothetical protein KAS32_14225 [Candidatus Peribacteraceae bacterium]|nr:hypothetical protein [Candidatus Peribacteraceae bacterium]